MEVRGQAVRQIERLTMRRRTRCEGVLGERTQDQGGYPQLDDVQRTQRERKDDVTLKCTWGFKDVQGMIDI